MVTFGLESQLERWEYKEIDTEKIKEVGRQLSLNPVLARLLLCRNLIDETSQDRLKNFLHPSKSLITEASHVSDPEHVKRAINRLRAALRNNEKIVVQGDPDADGITATTILVAGLRFLGGKVSYDFPVRATEGHGLQARVIEKAHHEDVKVIITADCGTKDVESIAYANTYGLDVIVTDHHIIGRELPPALAIINPFMVEGDNPEKRLSGAGVALKLMFLLFHAERKLIPSDFKGYLLAVCTLGTISDRMSLLEPMNRAILIRGVQALNDTQMEGLKALKSTSNYPVDELKAHEISRSIIPRLNAPGRIGNPAKGIADSNLVVDLLLVGTGHQNAERAGNLLSRFIKLLDFEKELRQQEGGESREQAAIVDEVNEQRKQITSQIEDEIDKLIDAQVNQKTDKIVIIRGKNWNPGVIGIDADRIKERFLRPAIILTEYPDSDYLRGSCRSIPTINLYKFIDETGAEFESLHKEKLFQTEVKTEKGVQLVNAFGGHPQACGFSIHKKNVDEFIRILRTKMESLIQEDFHYTYEIIDKLPFKSIRYDLVKALDHMAPFGQHFDYPAFLLEGCELSRTPRPFGNKYQKLRTPHVRFDVIHKEPGKRPQNIQAIGFGLWEKYQTFMAQNPDGKYDLIFTLEVQPKRGKSKFPSVRINVQDLRPSAE